MDISAVFITPTTLSEKVALITGGGQRIGANITRILHAAGANIILHYRHSRTEALALQEELHQQRADSVVLIQAELQDLQSLQSAISKALSVWNRLDILINNASLFYPAPVAEVTEKHWYELFDTNVKAPFFLAQATASALQKTSGCIINIVDIHAERPLKNYPVYSMSKASIAMMTKSLARELGPEIRVNGISPGAILWPENDMDEVTQQRIVSRTFLKRRGEPFDIAQMVLYLVTTQYITGQILAVDGGRSLNS